MAFDGVFAFQGKDHITASQLGRIVEGVAGKGRYVLPTLNQMTAEMQTANKVRVGTGDLVMDGRVVTNETAVDLTVESGTSGYKRNDLVVCRYTKNASTGVENFAAEVVKGTPTTGTAADPEVTEGDISAGSASAVMPLWRIPLDGINAGTPVKLFDAVSPLSTIAAETKKLGDSVSRPLFKTVKYTSPKTDVGSGNVLEYNGTLKNIKGYTPVGIVETNTNHDWSFGLMRATLNGDGTFTCTWMNFNKNTWRGSIGYATVLYIRS